MSTDTARAPMPSISVVIPAFDAERHLTESIDSVLAQDLAPLEVLVVDDGSTDATATIIESYGEPVRGLRHPHNRGEAAARNTGLSAAVGQAVAMHDADDRMLPHRLRTQAEHLVGGGDGVGCVLGRQRTFSEDGSALPDWALDAHREPFAYGSSLVLAWRTTYDRVGGYDESFVKGTDSDWLIRVREAGLRVDLIDEPLTERRVHDTNASTAGGPPTRMELTRALRKVMADRRRER